MKIKSSNVFRMKEDTKKESWIPKKKKKKTWVARPFELQVFPWQSEGEPRPVATPTAATYELKKLIASSTSFREENPYTTLSAQSL